MAKRKRLVVPAALERSDTETSRPQPQKAILPDAKRPALTRAPIAQVAGDAAVQSALENLAEEVASARREGRFVEALPLTDIRADHMVRDRMVIEDDEMAALKASIAARGQQSPIEVVAREDGAYGLVSGWRRLQALTALYAETNEETFATVKALVRPARSVSDSYIAMVEENEIRVGLSYYERAHLAVAAAELGVYETPAEAVQTLFANGSAAKRSKINAFVRLRQGLGDTLRFPAAIPERLGLSLAAALEDDPDFARRLKDRLRKTPASDAAEEKAALQRALKSRSASPEARPGVKLSVGRSRVVLSGAGVTDGLVADLRAWLAARQ